MTASVRRATGAVARALYEERRDMVQMAGVLGARIAGEMGAWEDLDEQVRDEWRAKARRVLYREAAKEKDPSP